jgi:hypothetical protein
MKLDVDLTALDALLRRMGAAPVDISIARPSLDPVASLISRLEGDGIEISPSDIEFRHGRLLTHKGQQVLLYIKDSHKSDEDVKDILNRPRFHIYHCKKLEEMKQRNRFERYVVSRRADGRFSLIVTDQLTQRKSEIETELNVCRFCLEALQIDGYERGWDPSSKKKVVEEFSIRNFFRTYQTFFPARPSRFDVELGPDDVDYVKDWDRISREFRAKRNWTCDSCAADCSQDRGLLHCHHVDGQKRNNSSGNLRALCVVCHAEQPNHGHMRVSASDRSRIEELRRRVDSRSGRDKVGGARRKAGARR